MTDILDLDGWAVLNRHQEDGVDVLEAEYAPEPTACLKCGTIGHLYRHGTKETTYLATAFPATGAAVRMLKRVQDGRCQTCGAELGRNKDDSPYIATVVRSKTRRQLLICAACNAGFHTEALSHKKPPSTR